MDIILADNIFKCIFLNENDRIPFQNLTEIGVAEIFTHISIRQ